MNALAKACGTSSANLTHYFGSRAELLGVVLTASMDEHRDTLRALATPRPGADAHDDLVALLELLREVWFAEAGLARIAHVAMGEGALHDESRPACDAQVLGPLFEAAATRLARLIASGRLPHMDVERSARALLAPLVLEWVVAGQSSLEGDALVGAWIVGHADW